MVTQRFFLESLLDQMREVDDEIAERAESSEALLG